MISLHIDVTRNAFGYDCILNAARLSVHLLRPYLVRYQKFLEWFRDRKSFDIYLQMIETANLDCMLDMANLDQSDLYLVRKALERIIRELRYDRVHSKYLAFCSYEQRHAEIINILKILLPRIRDDARYFAKLALQSNCHEFFTVLKQEKKLQDQYLHFPADLSLLINAINQNVTQRTIQAFLAFEDIDVRKALNKNNGPYSDIVLENLLPLFRINSDVSFLNKLFKSILLNPIESVR